MLGRLPTFAVKRVLPSVRTPARAVLAVRERSRSLEQFFAEDARMSVSDREICHAVP